MGFIYKITSPSRFGNKNLGTFDSKDEAEAAIQAHIASQTV
jgi:hypothetical protein